VDDKREDKAIAEGGDSKDELAKFAAGNLLWIAVCLLAALIASF